MSMTPPEIQPNLFDQSKPFYPLVVHFVCQLFGFKELAARGLMPQLRRDLERGADPAEELRRLMGEMNPGPARETIARMAQAGSAVELMPPLDLGSKAQGGPIHVDAEQFASEIAGNAQYLAGWLMRAAGSLLIVAWESTEESHNGGPLWEFLRHCRNAAAHNGRFQLLRNEPARPAAWASFTITKQLHDSPLFDGIVEPGLLAPGDPIRLLWDIEQAYAGMAA